MTAGRPTSYTKELLDDVKYYLKNYEAEGDKIPSVAGLSTYLKVARSTIYDWASQEDKKEFSDMLENILSEQEKILINKGLTGDFNSTIAKLVLGKHGYSDKAETDLTTKGQSILGLNDEEKIKLLGLINDKTGSN